MPLFSISYYYLLTFNQIFSHNYPFSLMVSSSSLKKSKSSLTAHATQDLSAHYRTLKRLHRLGGVCHVIECPPEHALNFQNISIDRLSTRQHHVHADEVAQGMIKVR